jgi:hypothetical protein
MEREVVMMDLAQDLRQVEEEVGVATDPDLQIPAVMVEAMARDLLTPAGVEEVAELEAEDTAPLDPLDLPGRLAIKEPLGHQDLWEVAASHLTHNLQSPITIRSLRLTSN